MAINNPSILNHNAISLLAQVEVDVNLAAPTTTSLFIVPVGKRCIVTHVILAPAAAGFTTCAAAVDLDFGKAGAPTDWANACTIAALTSVELCIILKSPETWENASPLYDAGETFQVVVNTGAAAGSLVDINVFGYLDDP